MNIFNREKREVNDTGLRYADAFLAPQVNFKVAHDINPKQQLENPTQSEHELQLRLFIRFRANQAQYTEALAYAEIAMLHFLYKDALTEVAMIRKLVMDGNRSGLFAACERLEQAMGVKP